MGKPMLGVLVAAGTVLSGVSAGCGHGSAQRSQPTASVVPRGAVVENVGTGVLSRTRFVVPPIATRAVIADGRDVGFGIFARLNRDIPRRSDGLPRARFLIEGVAGPDPFPYRIYKRESHCFAQGVGGARLTSSLPKLGRVRVQLEAFDSAGHTTGSLSTTVPLIKEPEYAATDYFTDPVPRNIGCGKARPGQTG